MPHIGVCAVQLSTEILKNVLKSKICQRANLPHRILLSTRAQRHSSIFLLCLHSTASACGFGQFVHKVSQGLQGLEPCPQSRRRRIEQVTAPENASYAPFASLGCWFAYVYDIRLRIVLCFSPACSIYYPCGIHPAGTWSGSPAQFVFGNHSNPTCVGIKKETRSVRCFP